MRSITLIGLILLILISVGAGISANDQNDDETPPWMEKVDGKARGTYLVPKGAKREIVGAQIIVEPPNEYTARRLYEIEKYINERFEKVEGENNALKEQLTEIKNVVATLEEKIKQQLPVEGLPQEKAQEQPEEPVY